MGTDADAAHLGAIRRHLASFLPWEVFVRIWEEGFATNRQQSFRINGLRLSSYGGSYYSDGGWRRGWGEGGGGEDGGGIDVAASRRAQREAAVVSELMTGLGLPADTPLEACPYFPTARLLPAGAPLTPARVKAAARSLPPLRTGAVYFMGLASMLPALALMAHRPAGGSDSYNHHHHHQQQQQQPSQPPGVGGGGGDGTVSASGLRVLDLCAAPGGKTALLAELMGNRGTLLAVDPSWPRMQRMRSNLQRLIPDDWADDHTVADSPVGVETPAKPVPAGAAAAAPAPGAAVAAAAALGGTLWRRGCVTALHADGRRLAVGRDGLPLPLPPPPAPPAAAAPPPSSPGTTTATASYDGTYDRVYDRVLVDAPCSGLGRVQLGQVGSYGAWNPELAAAHAARQRRLLAAAARLLAAGGSLVYSTCTLDPAENEEVVAWVLAADPALRLVEPHLVAPMPHQEYSPHIAPPITGTLGATATSGSHPVSVNLNTISAGVSGAGGGGSFDNGGSGGGISGAGGGGSGAGGARVPLREALEAHRPGCTYPALLDGAGWRRAWASGAAAAAKKLRASDGGGSGDKGRRGSPPPPPPQPPPTEAEVRGQLERCCVRIAPGPTYEGFFLAQFVREE